MTAGPFEIFLAAPPGLEPVLAEEARAAGFEAPVAVPGGVTTTGDWPEVWRANLALRGAARVLVRIGGFPVFHLAQLDKRAHKFPWAEFLRADVPVKVEAICRRSKIYHAGAAAQRIETAIADVLGAPTAEDAPVRLIARIEDNFCSFSLDTSGEPLHRRGLKEQVGKAPMRETLASLFLRQAGYDGTGPVLDPMCGSGTFPIEAAEIAGGFLPGRARGFAFEQLASFDAAAASALKGATTGTVPPARFFGYDRDQGAIAGARANAERAGLGGAITFGCQPISDLARPEGPPGLVTVNPPYGERIGNRKLLFALYGSLGAVLKDRFTGWRLALVTSDAGLAKATALPFRPPGATVAHGPLKITLWQTEALR
ncbi:THUMP domain-containing class I SAM-dependent RNA methyltransferase [Anianabacter salinae]|uniref:THUMP domain-containing class I SAM-dependent RNA methyltransferase n=1 Tax=Anianabacter salinae TaxID=2851023 RepID=UPI00225E08AA|nr:class I SAM-dependent RNA methyltransferase [Anianabacter salinae]MBV0911576.1 class I SAM-dependent RNA methyltransferase [Anianabacter salinae]